MGANDLIFTLRESGFSISAENSRLQIAPAKELTDELKQTIVQSKIEILCALHQEEELKRMVYSVCVHHGFTQPRYEETLMAALSDPANALIRYAASAHEANLFQSWSRLVPTKENRAHKKTNINKLKHVTGRLK